MRISLVGLIAAFTLAAVAVPAASAEKGQCLGGVPGAKCTIWDAKVGPVDDGDTINVRVEGKGKMEKLRLNGVQAPELHVYKKNHLDGDCGAVKATQRLQQLIKGSNRTVKLYAMHANSKTDGNRLRYRRTVGVKMGGKWTDVGSMLMSEGHALWIPNGDEWAWNGPYSRPAQEAQPPEGHLEPEVLRRRPVGRSPLSLKVKWDAEDNDAKNINGEWVRITNLDPTNAGLAQGLVAA